MEQLVDLGAEMARHVLASLAALALGVAAQTSVAAVGDARSSPTGVGDIICAGMQREGAHITIGEAGAGQIELTLDAGGTCGRPVRPTELTVSSGAERLYIRTSACPAFNRQAIKLHPTPGRWRPWNGEGPTPSVQVGKLAVTNWVGFFDLRSPTGRLAAQSWVLHTLAVVRPCWTWDATDDDAPHFVDRLYKEVGLKPR